MATKGKDTKKPGKLDKKAEAKELEAQRLAEEQRLLEEQKLREKEEARRREAIQLSTGLTLLLNEYCVQDGWKHPKPKEFLIEFVSRVLKDKDVLENFEPVEISIIAEFHLYNMIFAKEQLELDDQKTIVLLNLLWLLLMNKNPLYEKKIDLTGIDQEGKDKLLRGKTKESDLAEFKQALVNHCIDNPPSQLLYFGPGEAKRILEYANNSYFMHYALYRYTAVNKQKEKEVKMTIYVDKPLPMRPLKDAMFGQEKQEVKQDNQAEKKKETEELKKHEEEEKARLEEIARKQKEEEDNRLDSKTMAIIQAKLKETKELLDKQLDDREKFLNEKLEALNPKKKK